MTTSCARVVLLCCLFTGGCETLTLATDDVSSVRSAVTADLQSISVTPSTGFGNSFNVVSSVQPGGSVSWSGGAWVINVQASSLPLGSDLQHITLDITDAVGQPVTIRATSISTALFAQLGTATTAGTGQRQSIDIATSHAVASGETFTLLIAPGGTSGVGLSIVAFDIKPLRSVKLSPYGIAGSPTPTPLYSAGTSTSSGAGTLNYPIIIPDGTQLAGVSFNKTGNGAVSMQAYIYTIVDAIGGPVVVSPIAVEAHVASRNDLVSIMLPSSLPNDGKDIFLATFTDGPGLTVSTIRALVTP